MMPTQRAKFKISIKELLIEYEGDRETAHDFQNGIQQSLTNMMGTQARALALEHHPLNVIDAEVEQSKPKRKRKRQASTGIADQDEAAQANDDEHPRSRRRGDSVGSLISNLIDEGFFSEERGLKEIQNALSHKGHNVGQPAISAAVLPLTKKGKLSRKKDEKGKWMYTKGPKP